jgi:hypothetical protein
LADRAGEPTQEEPIDLFYDRQRMNSLPNSKNPHECDINHISTTMTDLLEKAIAKLKTLPPSQQNAIAAMILEELEGEQL